MPGGSQARTAVPVPLGLATGATVGFFASHTGLAGSIIALPVLHNFSRLQPKQITGTVLCFTTVSAGAGAAAYAYHGLTDVRRCLSMGLAGAATAVLGSLASSQAKPVLLKRATAAALICISPVIAFGRPRAAPCAGAPFSPRAAADSQGDDAPPRPRNINTVHFVAAGALAGFSQGFIGVGGGLVMTSLMTVATDMSQHAIIATALSATTLINVSATMVHLRIGNVHTQAALVISAAAVGAAVAASFLAVQIDEQSLRRGLAAVVIASSVGMLK
eukprot:COSAG05_NODE_468_length_9525_cov_30.402292_11_plen_275_part_00